MELGIRLLTMTTDMLGGSRLSYAKRLFLSFWNDG